MINDNQRDYMVKELIDGEIKNVIWSGKEGKSPGLDGFTLFFSR